jgi:C-3',4' desaturase CrtD
MYDVAIVGGGMAGMATALRLQAERCSTVVFEAHGQPGGCAGFFRRRGFSFDVGATTLVDFEPGGVGGELLESVGLPPISGDRLDGYVAWLPDRSVTLHRDQMAWASERLRSLGDSPAHREFWRLIDRLADTFWKASRSGIRMPIRALADAILALRSIGVKDLSLVRYLGWTMADALRAHGLGHDRPLVSLLSMLIEDTVHSTVEDAPLINAALGITIRGAGLTRAKGGMRRFWLLMTDHYRRLGGVLRCGCAVTRVTGRKDAYRIETRRGTVEAAQVVSAVPAALAARIGPAAVTLALHPYRARDHRAQGSALVLFAGVPDHEVQGHEFTHHQILADYGQPLGNGNNMFISVSAKGDTWSAPAGHRAVMISTHCALEEWEGLCESDYAARKAWASDRLIGLARRVYPELCRRPVVFELGTPRTFERFTGRPRGAVGGFRQSLANSNQNAIPHDLRVPGFWLVGDTTWPGLGTVACVLGSRVVAQGVLAGIGSRRRLKDRSIAPPVEPRYIAHAVDRIV